MTATVARITPPLSSRYVTKHQRQEGHGPMTYLTTEPQIIGAVAADVEGIGSAIGAAYAAAAGPTSSLPAPAEDMVLAGLYAWHRAMRIFDGPDQVHLRTIARTEIGREQSAFAAAVTAHG